MGYSVPLSARGNGDDHPLQMNLPDAMRQTENAPKTQIKGEFFDPYERRRIGCRPVMKRKSFARDAHLREYSDMEIRKFHIAAESFLEKLNNPVADAQFRRPFLSSDDKGCRWQEGQKDENNSGGFSGVRKTHRRKSRRPAEC